MCSKKSLKNNALHNPSIESRMETALYTFRCADGHRRRLQQYTARLRMITSSILLDRYVAMGMALSAR